MKRGKNKIVSRIIALILAVLLVGEIPVSYSYASTPQYEAGKQEQVSVKGETDEIKMSEPEQKEEDHAGGEQQAEETKGAEPEEAVKSEEEPETSKPQNTEQNADTSKDVKPEEKEADRQPREPKDWSGNEQEIGFELYKATYHSPDGEAIGVMAKSGKIDMGKVPSEHLTEFQLHVLFRS